jgi:hypothetical protein
MSDKAPGYSPFMDPAVPAETKQAWRQKGGRGRLRALSSDQIPWLSFANRERVKRFAKELAYQVLTGQLDPRLSAEARGCATLALQCDELEFLERLEGLELKVFGKRLG